MHLKEQLEQTYNTVYFGDFSVVLCLLIRYLTKGIYAMGTVRSNRKQMPQMKEKINRKRQA